MLKKTVTMLSLLSLPLSAFGSEKLFPASVHLGIKSFIAPILPTQVGFEDADSFQRDKAADLAKFTNLTATSNPVNSDEADKDYRLWSGKDFQLLCYGNKVVSFTAPDVNFAMGPEVMPYLNIPIQPKKGEIVFDNASVQKDGKIHFEWKVRARPPVTSDLLFSGVRERTSVYIWQDLTGTIECDSQSPKGYQLNIQFSGSAFPSHRVWEETAILTEIKQGVFEDLWKASSLNSQEIESN